MLNKKKKEQKNTTSQDIHEMLDKLIQIQENDNEPSFLRKTIYVVTGICVIIFTILICISIYKNNFSTESILSTFLAFFSIFISIFFYFKADETSTNFYNSSYDFMKDISVTLGKIEERFGEKLNSLNDKVSHLDLLSKEASQKIEDKQEDKDSIINELMEKANLNEEEKIQYRKELEEKEKEIEELRDYRAKAEQEAIKLQKRIRHLDYKRHISSDTISSHVLLDILARNEIPSEIHPRLLALLEINDLVDSKGNPNREKIINYINTRTEI